MRNNAETIIIVPTSNATIRVLIELNMCTSRPFSSFFSTPYASYCMSSAIRNPPTPWVPPYLGYVIRNPPTPWVPPYLGYVIRNPPTPWVPPYHNTWNRRESKIYSIPTTAILTGIITYKEYFDHILTTFFLTYSYYIHSLCLFFLNSVNIFIISY